MDLAMLGLAVDSREVVDASKDLDRIREAAARAERAADSFGVRMEMSGKRAAAANDNVARSAERATRAYSDYSRAAELAARAMGAVVGAAVGTALIRFADAWSDITSRVGLAVRNMDAAPAVLARIAQTARMTYSSLELTAEGFIRNAVVLNELGKSTQQQLDYQEALNNALVVSGAKGRAAEFVQESLNRSMALGAMRGIELNNVLNYGGRIAELLAKHFNTTTGGLMRLAQQGKITSDVLFNVLTGNMAELRKEAESMPATIGDGLILIRNALMQYIGGLDQASGASETFSKGLIAIADNVGRIVSIAAAAVTAYGTYYVGAFVAAHAATITLAGALTFLRGALIRTGIGAVIVLAGELIYQFGQLVQATGSLGEAFQEVGRRSEILLDAVVWGFRAAGDAIQSIWAGAMADILRTTEEAFGGILRLLGVSADEMAASISSLEKRAANMGEAAKSSAIIAAEQFKRAFEEIKIPGADVPDAPGVRTANLEDFDKAAEKAAKAYKRIVEGAHEFIAAQRLEASVIGMTEQAANALRYEMDLLNDAKRAGIALTPQQTAELKALAQQMAATEAATKSMQQQYEQMKETWEDVFQSARDGIDGLVDSLFDGTKSFGDALKQAGRDFARMMFDLSVVNPFKNWLTGSNLNSIADLGIFGSGATSGKGGGFGGVLGNLLGAQKAVASMQVQAASVIVNGSVLGGAGGIGAGLPNILGGTAANDNNAMPMALSGIGSPGSGLMAYGNDMASNIKTLASKIGADPRELAAVMSFESGFRPNIWGGSGGNHFGLIQAGAAERAAYGITPGGSLADQFAGIERYFKDRGFKPGMSGMDLYSTVNAGSPGRYNASDTMNGGTWGTVADKWNHQMGPHFGKADALLGSSNKASEALDKLATGSISTAESLASGLGGLTGVTQSTMQALEQFGIGAGNLGSMLQNLMTTGGGFGGNWFSNLAGMFGGAGGALNHMNAISPMATAHILKGGVGLFANGAAFSGGNVIPFANGDVFSSPAYFPMSGGKTGLLGEAGPEAIMPLRRGPDGKLGVSAGTAQGQQNRGMSDAQIEKIIAAFGKKLSFNVKNVNVSDPSVVGDYLNTDEGERLIMNVIRRNRAA